MGRFREGDGGVVKIWYCGSDPGSALQVNLIAQKTETRGLLYYKWLS